jgi:DNA-binding winged helix-turn-helix (wHTH) protein
VFISNAVNNLYEFGVFRFEGESRTLRRGDEMISLSPKALDVLFPLPESDDSARREAENSQTCPG